MTKEEYLRKMGDPRWYGEQDENGVDLSLIRENLKLTPEERLRRMEQEAEAAMELRKGGREERMKDKPRARRGLFKIAELLNRHDVEFIVVGGQAEWLMGSPRMTVDVDVCYRRTPENLQRLADALKTIKPTLRGAPEGLPFVLDAKALEMGNNFTLTTTIGSVDLLGWVEPLGDFEAVAKNAETYTRKGVQFKVISLDDLIRVKEHIRRVKDTESLIQLRSIRDDRNRKPGPHPG